jgi:predicted TIM-barrel fold metal-dependent hydrolase
MPHAFDEDPIEAFKRNVWISPFHEDDIAGLIDAIGADKILFGSDYPHPEGLAEPAKFVNDLSHLPEGLVRKIMGGNLAKVMGVGVPA